MPPPKPEPGAKQPKVYIATPNGDVTITTEVVNTWPKIEKGLIVMLVGFAPLKPAEFVLLQIQIKAAVSA